MNLYWSRNKIPEWKDIDKEKHREIVATISKKALRQPWVIFCVVLQFLFFVWFGWFSPEFEYKLLIFIVVVHLSIKVAFLPYNFYFRKHLVEYLQSNS